MLMKTINVALLLGLTSVCAIASNDADVSSIRKSQTLSQDAPSNVDLVIEAMPEPSRQAIKAWKANCDKITNYLSFTIGELNVKAKLNSVNNSPSHTNYEKAQVEDSVANRIHSLDVLSKELSELVRQTLGFCLGRFMMADEVADLYRRHEELGRKTRQLVVYDVWGYSNKLQDYISETYKNILENETRLEILNLDTTQKQLLMENLKVLISLHGKYMKFSEIGQAADNLSGLHSALQNSLGRE